MTPEQRRLRKNEQMTVIRRARQAAITGSEEWHGTPSGYTNHRCRCDSCKAGYKAYHDEWRNRPDVAEKRREQARLRSRTPENVLRKRAYGYGLTPVELRAMLDRGRCDACGSTDSGSPMHDFAVDHDHSCCPGPRCCGKCVRGLLCRACNVIAGMVNDDAEHLRKLIAYLESGRRELQR